MTDNRVQYMADLSRAFNRGIRDDVAQLTRRAMREMRVRRKDALMLAEVVVLYRLNSMARANFEGPRP